MRPQNFSKNLKRLRKQAGLSQRALSEKAGLGKTAVHQLENGHCEPNLNSLMRLVLALNTNLKVILK